MKIRNFDMLLQPRNLKTKNKYKACLIIMSILTGSVLGFGYYHLLFDSIGWFVIILPIMHGIILLGAMSIPNARLEVHELFLEKGIQEGFILKKEKADDKIVH